MYVIVLSVTVCAVGYVCLLHRVQISVDFVSFLSMIIYEVLYSLLWCLRYNICSARLLDIRISTCSQYTGKCDLSGFLLTQSHISHFVWQKSIISQQWICVYDYHTINYCTSLFMSNGVGNCDSKTPEGIFVVYCLEIGRFSNDHSLIYI